MRPHVTCRQTSDALCDRFGLRDGQFFAIYTHKNLWWEVNGDWFGYGDLRHEDIFRIKDALDEDEIFQGWNEHHGSQWQQRDTPIIRVTRHIVISGDLLHLMQKSKK